MAWTSLGSTPGTLYTDKFIDPTAPEILNLGGTCFADINHPEYSPGIDIGRELGSKGPLGFPNVLNQGWINFSASGGGGGGSTRPSSGFLYPRGN